MTVYDKAEWHEDGSFEVIGRYLDWLVRRGLVDQHAFETEHLEAIAWDEMHGSDLEDYVDGVLASDLLSPEGDAFTRHSYATYVERLAGLGPGDGLDAALDDLLERWRAGGAERVPPARPVRLRADPDELLARVESGLAENIVPPECHDVPEAERLLPVDLVDPPLRVESMRARTWGAGLLNRALSRLGISPDGVVLLTGMGGPNGVAYIAVYVVPGAPAPGLQHEFRRVIYKGGGRWVERRFGGRVVVMAEGHPPGFDVLFWAVDGHVVHLAGSLPVLEPLVARLPAGVADETQPVGWRPT
ncbi:MAG: hypothetical protein U0667_01850 [Chloroflexota bacterium]